MPHTTYGLLKAIRSHQIDSPSVTDSLATGRPNACNLCHLDRTMAWTADHLSDWYGSLKPEMSEDDQSVSASVLWLLRGDAGQRALIAWSMGWQPAREASGSEWMGPFLAQLLEDPYDAVRFIAHRSLRRLPRFGDFEYDFMAPENERTAAKLRALDIWERLPTASDRPKRTAILFDSSGALKQDIFNRLLKLRNNRPVFLLE